MIGALLLPYKGSGPPPRSCVIPVTVAHEYADRWLARYDSRWRRVHIQVNRTYIVHRGKRITILIEGV